jgi:recombinational DNA repair ATPase RecF
MTDFYEIMENIVAAPTYLHLVKNTGATRRGSMEDYVIMCSTKHWIG